MLVAELSAGGFDDADFVGAGIVAGWEEDCQRGIFRGVIEDFFEVLYRDVGKERCCLRIPPALGIVVSAFIYESCWRLSNVRMSILWIPL